MLRKIFSDLSTFKEIDFRPGFNIILAERTEKSSAKGTRNSTGKSSLVELIHFVLGSRGGNSLPSCSALRQSYFGLCLDVGHTSLSVARTASNANRIYLDCAAINHEQWLLESDEQSGRPCLSNHNWCKVLGKEFFDIPDSDSKYTPSFRLLFPYFARRQSSMEFHSPTELQPKAKPYQFQVSLSYLLGLDWQVARDFQLLRDREIALQSLKREAESGAFDEILGKTGEVQAKLVAAEADADKLGAQISGFRVIPDYGDFEQNAAIIRRDIRELGNENTTDREYLQQLTAHLEEEIEPDIGVLMSVYREANVLLPELVRHRFEDVETFHRSVIKNRRLYLKDEIEQCKQRITARSAEQQRLALRRQEIVRILETTGALDDFKEIQREYAVKQAEVEDLRRQLTLIRQITRGKAELKESRQRLFVRLQQDIEERKPLLDHAALAFRMISSELYDAPGELRIEESDRGPVFDPHLQHDGGQGGVHNMATFCFDLALACVLSTRGLGVGFLIHDSHIFDGVESRQRARALVQAKAMSERFGFQYLALLNSDEIPHSDLPRDFALDDHVLPVRLYDVEGGGLFGFSFEHREKSDQDESS